MNPTDPLPISRVERRLVYENRWIALYEDTTESAGGRGTYSVLSRPDAVAVVVTSPDDSVLMLHSFRYPTGMFSLELPMGAVDPGETPAAAARRELREETGLTDADLEHLGWFYALPGLTDQKVHVFAATVPVDQLRHAHSHESEADIAGTALVGVAQLPALVAHGRVTDSVTLCSLFLRGLGPGGAGARTDGQVHGS